MKNIISIIFVLAAVYQLNAQCIGSGHSTNAQDMWASCQETTNPNSVRGSSHWVLYDLGYNYSFTSTVLWNYNVPGETNKGIKCITIDYSLDGVTWTQAGKFNLDEASGTSDYEGITRNDLNGKTARYILLTAVNTWGSVSCAGLSEVRFNVTEQLALHCGDDDESSLYLNLFPNPATNYISIDMDVREENGVDFAKQSYDNLHIILTNNTGHELARYPVNAEVERLDISGLPSGMYFITVLGNDYQSCTRRFLKK